MAQQPPELWLLVWEFLDPDSLFSCHVVCKRWNCLLSAETLLEITPWTLLFQRHWKLVGSPDIPVILDSLPWRHIGWRDLVFRLRSYPSQLNTRLVESVAGTPHAVALLHCSGPFQSAFSTSDFTWFKKELHTHPRALCVAYIGDALGGDRCVTADAPFPPLLPSNTRKCWLRKQARRLRAASCCFSVLRARVCRALCHCGGHCSRDKTCLTGEHPIPEEERKDCVEAEQCTCALQFPHGHVVRFAYLSLVAYFEVTLGDPQHDEARALFAREGQEEEKDIDFLHPSPGHVDCIAVGLGNSRFPLRGQQPGWNVNSWGYHGDDGRKFHASGSGQPYGPPFGVGDTVGCGLDYTRNRVFFTKNGKFLGPAFENVEGELFPVVGLDARWSVAFNFGSRPFVFDVFSFERLA